MSEARPPAFSPIGIGDAADAPFAVLPDPAALFARRAARLAALAAEDQPLAPYLRFLATIVGAQASVAAALPPLAGDATSAERAIGFGMPPIDRARLAGDPALEATAVALFDVLADTPLPDAASEALAALREAAPDALRAALALACDDAVPMDAVAEHVLAAAAAQLHATRLAATLPAAELAPVGDGACPACGAAPVASVIGRHGPAVRHCACSLCGTEWNVVRVKCAICGSTEGIAYHRLEDAESSAPRDATTVEAETCERCRCYTKILATDRQPELEAVADDVATLGLDLKLREAGWQRGSRNPFLAGY